MFQKNTAKPWLPIVFVFFSCCFLAFVFSNCSQTFESTIGESKSVNNNSTPKDKDSNNNDNNNDSTKFNRPILTFETLDKCINTQGVANTAECLKNHNELPDNLIQSTINVCSNSFGNEAWNIANCLWKSKIYVDQYRIMKQIDINHCYNSYKDEDIADCLLSHGFENQNISLKDITDCANSMGKPNVETCLRMKSLLPHHPILTKSQLDLCINVYGQAKLEECLSDSDVLPINLKQSDINDCISSDGSQNLMTCLRQENWLEKAPQQIHFNECKLANYPENQTYNCLLINGFKNLEFTQNEIDFCISNFSFSGLSKCIRTSGKLDKLLTQENITICQKVDGEANIAECLLDNGLKPESLNQAAIDDCIKDVGLENVAQCLAQGLFIPTRWTQLIEPGGVFATHCLSCHGNSGSLDLKDYGSTMDRVTAGDSINSLLVQRMLDTEKPMPPNGLLQENEINQVKSWIDDGALMN